MVLVSHRYKFIYLKNAKVAGSSVESFFAQYCIDPNIDFVIKDDIELVGAYGGKTEFGEVGSIGDNGPHATAVSIKNEWGEEMFNEYFKFCVIRNPYDKIVSSYYYWKNHPTFNWVSDGINNYDMNNMTFKEFCRLTDCINLNIHCIGSFIDSDNISYPVSCCNYIIRYENLEEDIIKVCEKLGIEKYDLKLLPKYKSNTRPKDNGYRDYYDDETKKLVFDKHKKEFEKFGYEF